MATAASAPNRVQGTQRANPCHGAESQHRRGGGGSGRVDVKSADANEAAAGPVSEVRAATHEEPKEPRHPRPHAPRKVEVHDPPVRKSAPLAAPTPALIAAVQQGDKRALDELTRLIRPHVERQLARYPVSDDDRLDLVQSTLLQVVRRIQSFRGDSSFTTWLFRVTANEALMLMRSQRRQRARLVEGLDFEDLGVLPTMRTVSHDDMASMAEREAFVRSALGELPEDYRDIVMAHYHEELGLQEIAQRFMVTESAVRSRLHRARVRLRAILNATPVGRELSAEAAA